MWLDTNHRPIINNADDAAVFNRLHPITFAFSVPKENQDPKLAEALLKESAGIIAWTVEGAKQWYAGGLRKPKEVDAARKDWKDDSDHIARFLEERCDVSDQGAFVRASELYFNYQGWAKAAGVFWLSETAFGTKISAREGIEKKRAASGNLYFGLKLQPVPHQPKDEEEH